MVMAPVAAIARRAQRGELDNGIHGVEQFPVVTDNDGARPRQPARRSITALRPSRSKIVSRFIKQDEIQAGKDECGKPGPVRCPPDSAAKAFGRAAESDPARQRRYAVPGSSRRGQLFDGGLRRFQRDAEEPGLGLRKQVRDGGSSGFT